MRQHLLLLSVILPVLTTDVIAAEPQRTDVFVSGADGYHTFRIPSIIVTPKDTLLAICEGRKTGRGDHGDLDLVAKRSRDGGKSWSAINVIYEEGGNAKITIGNPCPVVDRSTGTIWMPFCRNNDTVLITHSQDDGETWSKPRDITRDVKKPNWSWYATGPGVGIQLSRERYKGRLVIPCDHRERIEGQDVTHSHVFYSDDHGKSWKLGESVALHTNECQVVELSNGTLMINCRNYWARSGSRPDRAAMRAIAYSKDGGATWSKLEFDKTLVEPVCQASLLLYSQADDQLLFSNPASTKSRHRLTIRLSQDGGRTWPKSKWLHAGPSAYSCLTVLSDKSIGCLYEGGEKTAYEKIIFARFPLAWLLK